MADDADPDPPFEVGYRKPPKRTQFPKGQSGNPRGRPKGSGNFQTAILKELKRRVPITEDGKRKKITKREAVAKQLVNKAAAGDPKAIPVLLNETRSYEAAAAATAAQPESMTEEDQKVAQGILRRFLESNAAARPNSEAELAIKPERGNDGEEESS
jgi:hypothetical protein